MPKVFVVQNVRDPQSLETHLRGVKELDEGVVAGVRNEFPEAIKFEDELNEAEKEEFAADLSQVESSDEPVAKKANK